MLPGLLPLLQHPRRSQVAPVENSQMVPFRKGLNPNIFIDC